jgi:hypothetical protein
MISTIEHDIKFENGVAKLCMKEYPDWYGIEDVGFIWRGSWSDPEIEYKGRRINSFIVEDTMWERFREDCEELGKNADDYIDDFDVYMKDNAEYVYELIELAIESIYGEE